RRPEPRPAAPPPAETASFRLACAAALIPLAAWVYLPVWRELGDKWLHDAGYSHGFLVPLFAAYLAWRRHDNRSLISAGGALLGYGLLALAAGMLVLGGFFSSPWLEELSLLPALVAAVALLGGSAAVRWLTPAVLYLFF